MLRVNYLCRNCGYLFELVIQFPNFLVVGVAERFSYYGISLNLVSYLTGNLGLPTATAAAILNAWYGTSSFLPILGAYVADALLGRFQMISAACVLYVAVSPKKNGIEFLLLSIQKLMIYLYSVLFAIHFLKHTYKLL